MIDPHPIRAESILVNSNLHSDRGVETFSLRNLHRDAHIRHEADVTKIHARLEQRPSKSNPGHESLQTHPLSVGKGHEKTTLEAIP
jgi:hypothetical protein